MMKANCIVDIYEMSGDEDSKAYSLVLENAKVLLLTASNETISFYPDYPVGTIYSFLLMDQLDEVKPESKLIITDPLQSKLSLGSSFIVKGKGVTKIVLSHTIVDGVCVKV